jgi:hypothetical protein
MWINNATWYEDLKNGHCKGRKETNHEVPSICKRASPKNSYFCINTKGG